LDWIEARIACSPSHSKSSGKRLIPLAEALIRQVDELAGTLSIAPLRGGDSLHAMMLGSFSPA
jgi:hypothetical protein